MILDFFILSWKIFFNILYAFWVVGSALLLSVLMTCCIVIPLMAVAHVFIYAKEKLVPQKKDEQ